MKCVVCGKVLEGAQRSTRQTCSGRCRTTLWRRVRDLLGRQEVQTETYVRCPLCSKVSRPQKFQDGKNWEHPLEIGIQSIYAGPGERMEWQFEPMSREVLTEIASMVGEVHRRLEALVDALDRTDLDPDAVLNKIAAKIEMEDDEAEQDKQRRLATDLASVLASEQKPRRR